MHIPERRRQRGIALIELALTLPWLITIIVLTLLFGSVLYSYSVAQKAAHDAVLYLSAVPLRQMRNTAAIGDELDVVSAIVAAETGALAPYAPDLTISCNSVRCTGSFTPTSVTVAVQFVVKDTLFAPVTDNFTGGEGINIIATATMRYAGN